MVSIIEYKGKTNGNLMSIAGKSTDEKPIKEIDGIAILNGSFYFEMDTKKVYMYSQEDSTWYEQ